MMADEQWSHIVLYELTIKKEQFLFYYRIEPTWKLQKYNMYKPQLKVLTYSLPYNEVKYYH